MKPIAFSRPMVLARRAGRKTQTRRLVKFLPGCCHDVREHTDGRLWPHWIRDGDEQEQPCPYGLPGEQLWVREDFQIIKAINYPDFDVTARYLADGEERTVTLARHEAILWSHRQFPYRKTPGRFMYQSLARDRPTLLAVRVERLQDITEEDAIVEGIEMDHHWDRTRSKTERWVGYPNTHDSAVQAFTELWESIHGHGSWAANPYVWVLTLTPFTAPSP